MKSYKISPKCVILIYEQKTKGTFQHSSFLAGGATTAAGRLVAQEGTLQVRIQSKI